MSAWTGTGERAQLRVQLGTRLEHAGGDCGGLVRLARHRSPRKARVAVFHLDGFEGHTERVGGDLSLCSRSTHAHLVEAALHDDRAVGRQTDVDVGGHPQRGVEGGRDAHADKPSTVAHRSWSRGSFRPAEPLRADSECFAQHPLRESLAVERVRLRLRATDSEIKQLVADGVLSQDEA
jgi:hypothetical protein